MSELSDVMIESKNFLMKILPDSICEDRVELPNIEFKTPNDKDWLRVNWVNFTRVSTDASNCYEIFEGVMTIDVFVPVFTSSVPATKMAEELKKKFLENTFENFSIPSSLISPFGKDGSWYRVQLDINYQYEGYVNANNSQ